MSQMFYSIRRLQRSQETNRERQRLNLVPLMDVFTILVFFFLVHSADVAQTAEQNLVNLPESLADEAPRQSIIVTLTNRDILFQGVSIASVDTVLASPDDEIKPLVAALRESMKIGENAPENTNQTAGELSIMGDKDIPFRLLRKVMLSSTRAGYERISLSVLQRSIREQ